jgi:hypothetical protein
MFVKRIRHNRQNVATKLLLKIFGILQNFLAFFFRFGLYLHSKKLYRFINFENE